MKIKAAFLLMVFCINTIIGFACALGFIMGFNCHKLAGKAESSMETMCHQNSTPGKLQSKQSKDNCCHDKIFQSTRINTTVPGFTSFAVPAFITLVSAFYHVNVLHMRSDDVNIKYFERNYHPPITDIRIAIQSFQI